MADPRRVELDELVNRPGTYFHPQTEIVVVVDDSAALDAEIFDSTEHEDTEWVLISDEIPIDENERDRLLEAFQVRLELSAATDDEDEDDDDEDELEPDEDPEDA